MSDDIKEIKQQLNQLQGMMVQLIDISVNTYAAVVELRDGQARLKASHARLEVGQTRLEASHARLEVGQTRLEAGQADLRAELSEVKDTVVRTDHRLNIMERRQGKMGDRLDRVEAEVELLQDGKQ